jgi:ubiquinone/menaquinone biosynthesis C-methylase UbiE
MRLPKPSHKSETVEGSLLPMIPRVLEPEAMDGPEEVRQYDAMDHSAVNARFVEDFLAAHGPCRGGDVVDVGTGTARIPIALARADSKAKVLALDISEPMLMKAAANIREAGLFGRIRIHHGDSKSLLHYFGEGSVEAVVSNTIVHHIPDPVPALADMARLVALQGTLFVRDLVRPESAQEIVRLADTYAGSETPAARALFEASLGAALTLEEIRAIVLGLGHDSNEVSMTSDRHWTWIWRRP